MASGRTSPAKIRLATTHEVSPEIELQLDAPAKAGQRVRVTVFDEDLFRTGELAKSYNRVFSVFIGASSSVVPQDVQGPASLIGDGSNGVLLTFECSVVGETPKGGERKHRKWAFGPPENVKTCSPKALLVDVALGLRNEHNEVAFGPLIRLPVARVFRMRRIVVIVSDPATNEILYSNTWRTKDLVKFNKQAGPTLLDSTAVEAAIPAKVGGDGEGTGAPAPAGRTLPSVDEAILLADRIVLMGAGRVLEVLDVDLERPRWAPAFRADKRFVELRSYLWNRIRDLVLSDPASDFFGRDLTQE